MIETAISIATRSPLLRHKTGAVIVDPKGEIVAVGWSHISAMRWTQFYSTHAEMHAIMRARPADLYDCTIYVATITRHGNITCGMPCNYCLNWIRSVGITDIVYTPPVGGGETPFHCCLY